MPPCRSWPRCLLTAEPLDLGNVPDLADIASTQRLLQHLGASATHVAGEAGSMVLHAPTHPDRHGTL